MAERVKQVLVAHDASSVRYEKGRSAAAAGHRGQDGYRVPVLDRRVQAGHEADVLVVQVHVDEAPQAVSVDQALAQAAVPLVQVAEQFGERGSAPLDLLGAVGVRAQDRRDANLDGHELCSTELSGRSLASNPYGDGIIPPR